MQKKTASTLVEAVLNFKSAILFGEDITQCVVVDVLVLSNSTPIFIVYANAAFGYVTQQIEITTVQHHQVDEGIFRRLINRLPACKARLVRAFLCRLAELNNYYTQV